jgi:small-conductance mechanosensitive channel
MSENFNAWHILRKLSWEDMLFVFGVFILSRLLTLAVQWSIHHFAKKASPRLRLSILRCLPLARLLIGITAIAIIVPILVEPTFKNVIMLVASIGLALAFALKDYGSSLVAGLTTVLENTYQPGDWIEVDGAYGEVKSIGMRAVRIVTLDDTEVIIPHLKLWSTSIFNASGGSRSMLCVADFYLNADHDASAVRRRLTEIAKNSPRRKPESPVVVTATEKPWGTHYRVKAYVKESREQMLFVTDLTIEGKEAIRSLGFRFAQAPYAEIKKR